MKSLFSRKDETAEPEEQPTAVVPAAEPVAVTVTQPADVPAGAEPVPAAGSLSFRDRGRLRRRLRYLRRVRELGFRDLGGLTFDLHRFSRQGQHLVQAKLNALAAVDGELRTLERALGEERDIVELREAGIAACPRCGALHGTDARFCPSCGVTLTGPRAVSEIGGVAPAEATMAATPAGLPAGQPSAASQIGGAVRAPEPLAVPVAPAVTPHAAVHVEEPPVAEAPPAETATADEPIEEPAAAVSTADEPVGEAAAETPRADPRDPPDPEALVADEPPAATPEAADPPADDQPTEALDPEELERARRS